MKSLLLLWSELANEQASLVGTCATMDIKTVQGRFEHEGVSFLTITLPEYGKDLEKGLARKKVDRSLFAGFQRKGELPRFLGGFLDLVFDRNGGRLLDNPSIDAIHAIRQLTLIFGKIQLECTPARQKAALSKYVQCEREVRTADRQLTSSALEEFRSMAAMLFSRAFTKIDRSIYHMEVLPKHGPGATADKLMGNQKFTQSTWPVRLERIFPAGEFLLPNWRYYDQLEDVHFPEPGQEQPVRVVLVPKTLKTPRVIGIEPTAMQYAQQAILRLVLRELGQVDYLRKIIGFDDQTPNQRMARMGSSNGLLATLDLSDASDRVSNQLVREMLKQWPYLHEAVDASRSRSAEIDGIGRKRLAKFASMGSALCFPMEAMVFTTCIFLGIQRWLNRPLTISDVKRLSSSVRVYGDDIIIPADSVSPVVHELEHFGARVNMSKSFWTGKFRESCGKEYFDGSDVSIVRVRHLFPTQRQDATGVIGIVALRNQFYKAGLWRTTRWLDSYIRDVINHFPDVHETSPVLGRHTFLSYETQRISKHTHAPQVKGYVVDAKIPKNSLEDQGALLKYLLKHPLYDENRERMDHLIQTGRVTLNGQPSVDVDHLERSGRPVAVNLKLRYASPF